MPVWAVNGQPASPELIKLLCDGDMPTLHVLGGQVVLR